MSTQTLARIPRWWTALDTTQRYLLLSLVTAAACVPVVTTPAALAAVQDVAAARARGADSSVVRGFVTAFRAHLRRGTIAGTVLLVLGAVLVLDFLLVARMGDERRVLLTALLAVTVPLVVLAAQVPVALRTSTRLLRVVVQDPAGALLRVLLSAALAVLVVSAPPLGILLVAPWARLVTALENPTPKENHS